MRVYVQRTFPLMRTSQCVDTNFGALPVCEQEKKSLQITAITALNVWNGNSNEVRKVFLCVTEATLQRLAEVLTSWLQYVVVLSIK